MKKTVLSLSVVMILALSSAGWAVSCAEGEGKSAADGQAGNAKATQEAAALIPAKGSPDPASQGMLALAQAADSNKYFFAFFYKQDDDETQAMRQIFMDTMAQVQDRADWVLINIEDKAEQEIIDKFDVSVSPMPLALAIAPNGAVTGGYPTSFSEASLMRSFVSPCTAECLLDVQLSKMAFLCVQNENTASNDAALAGVNAFKEDEQYAETVDVIMLDPTDEAEAQFLKQLQVDPQTKIAVTVFLAASGAVIGSYEGATDKATFIADLKAALGGGCGPGGCGPGGCK